MKLEVLQFDIVHPDIVEGIFHMILNVVECNQDEFSNHYYKVYSQLAVYCPYIIYDGRRIDERKYIDEY